MISLPNTGTDIRRMGQGKGYAAGFAASCEKRSRDMSNAGLENGHESERAAGTGVASSSSSEDYASKETDDHSKEQRRKRRSDAVEMWKT